MNARVRFPVGIMVALAMVFFASHAFAVDVGSDQEPVALAESAMQKIVVDDIDGAIQLLRPHAGVEWGELNAMTKNVDEAYKARPGGFGDPLGYAYVASDKLGDLVMRVTFVQKFKRKPIMWDFFFYKPDQTWLFWAFRFNGSPAIIFNLLAPPSSQPVQH